MNRACHKLELADVRAEMKIGYISGRKPQDSKSFAKSRCSIESQCIFALTMKVRQSTYAKAFLSLMFL